MESTPIHPGYASTPDGVDAAASAAAMASMYNYSGYCYPYQMMVPTQMMPMENPMIPPQVHPECTEMPNEAATMAAINQNQLHQMQWNMYPYPNYCYPYPMMAPSQMMPYPANPSNINTADVQPEEEHKVRRKGSRVPFSLAQINILAARFAQSNTISIKERRELSQRIGLTPLQIKIWFQNRRFKQRKEAEKNQETGANFQHQSLNLQSSDESMSTPEFSQGISSG